MTPATPFIPSAAQAEAILNLQNSFAPLSDIVITSKDYAPAVAKAKEAMKNVGRIHRNWNEVTNEPDGLYEVEEDMPKGARPPKVSRDELTSFEASIEDLIYYFNCSKPDAPTLTSAVLFDKALDEVIEIGTYHPDYDPNRGMI